MTAEDKNVKCYAALAQGLRDLDVETLFGLIGDANLFMVDAFARIGGRYIAAAHEAGAVLMALGYAQAANRVGVASITHGPALTNALTALVEGAKATIPMVLLVGDTAVEDREHLQKAMQREFIAATGAGFEQLRAPWTAIEDLARAFRRAALERRPIALNIPTNFQWTDIDYRKPHLALPGRRVQAIEGPEFDNAIGILAACKRPIALAGRGAFEFDAEAAIARLAERIEAPLATTLKAKGLFACDPFNLGIFGTLSNDIALQCIGESDCILAFGASMNSFTTAQHSLIKGKRLIEINAVADHIGRFTRPDAGIAGDLEAAAKTILHWLDQAEIAGTRWRSEELRKQITGYRPPEKVPGGRLPGTVDIRWALQRLDKAIPADRIYVCDGGRFMFESLPLFKTQGRRSFISTTDFASIGLGLGQAIGAAAASPDRTTLLVCGDGGFMLGGLVELNTAVRAKSNLIVLVCNDSSYGAEHIQFRRKALDPSISAIAWPDLAPIAQAMGGVGLTVRSQADLDIAIQAIALRNRQQPLLIDLKLDPDAVPSH